jgi:hypothetical protein
VTALTPTSAVSLAIGACVTFQSCEAAYCRRQIEENVLTFEDGSSLPYTSQVMFCIWPRQRPSVVPSFVSNLEILLDLKSQGASSLSSPHLVKS